MSRGVQLGDFSARSSPAHALLVGGRVVAIKIIRMRVNFFVPPPPQCRF
jgi:hypothetical protein